MFRMYDVDGDLKIWVNDFVSIFQILFYGNAYNGEGAHQVMAEQVVAKYGTAGFVKLEQFMNMIPEDQVRQFMTMKFL